MKSNTLISFLLLCTFLLFSGEVASQRRMRQVRPVKVQPLEVVADSLQADSVGVGRADTLSADSLGAPAKKEEGLNAPVSYEATDSIVFTQGGYAHLYGAPEHFPNLEKVILGGNRYMDASYIAEMGNSQMAKLEEIEESLRMLDWANKYLGVTVEHYNQHYFTTEEIAGRSYFNAMGNPELPALNYLDTEGWTITATDEEETGYDPGLKNLLDNNSETIWKPLPSSTLVREHEFVIDMKEEKTFKGFKITQKAFLSSGDGDLPYLPSFVKIQTSTNNVSWDIPLIAEENSIGNTPGESTILRMKSPITARYVRVTVNDVVYFGTFNTLLGDFMLFTD